MWWLRVVVPYVGPRRGNKHFPRARQPRARRERAAIAGRAKEGLVRVATLRSNKHAILKASHASPATAHPLLGSLLLPAEEDAKVARHHVPCVDIPRLPTLLEAPLTHTQRS